MSEFIKFQLFAGDEYLVPTDNIVDVDFDYIPGEPGYDGGIPELSHAGSPPDLTIDTLTINLCRYNEQENKVYPDSMQVTFRYMELPETWRQATFKAVLDYIKEKANG